MQQNPSQGIKKYDLGSVYTPSDSNSRRERMHFDFVVADEQFKKYTMSHAGAVDIGDLILQNQDGSGSAPALSPVIDRPISIYIDADTTENTKFDLNSGRIVAKDQLLSDRMILQMSQREQPPVVHLYTRCPYRINTLGGGWALHTTREAYALLPQGEQAWQAGGRVYIGSCAVENGSWTHPAGRMGDTLQIIYEDCFKGYLTSEPGQSRYSVPQMPASTKHADNLPAFYVCAPWQSSSVTPVIWLSRKCTRVYKVYSTIKESVDRGGYPRVRAVAGDQYLVDNYTTLNLVGTSVTQAEDGSATAAAFVFEGNGLKLEVSAQDELAWGSASGSGSRSVVITDFDPTEAIEASSKSPKNLTQEIFKWKDVHGGIGSGAQIYRDGALSFEAAKTSQAPGLKFKPGETSADWYFWFAVEIIPANQENVISSGSSQWFVNGRAKYFYIDPDSLEEGTVYELRCHCMLLPGGTKANFEALARMQDHVDSEEEEGQPTAEAKEVDLVFQDVDEPRKKDQGRTEANRHYGSMAYPTRLIGLQQLVYFYTASGGPYPVKTWGAPSSTSITGPAGLYPHYTPVSLESSSYVPEFGGFATLAEATVQFVKLNGTIYLMRY